MSPNHFGLVTHHMAIVHGKYTRRNLRATGRPVYSPRCKMRTILRRLKLSFLVDLLTPDRSNHVTKCDRHSLQTDRQTYYSMYRA